MKDEPIPPIPDVNDQRVIDRAAAQRIADEVRKLFAPPDRETLQ